MPTINTHADVTVVIDHLDRTRREVEVRFTSGREKALVLTKLDEAALWLAHLDTKLEG